VTRTLKIADLVRSLCHSWATGSLGWSQIHCVYSKSYTRDARKINWKWGTILSCTMLNCMRQWDKPGNVGFGTGYLDYTW